MRVLIIGGTGVISTGISNQLLERGGCDLTLFNRGKTAPEISGQFRVEPGDRTDFKAFEAWAARQKMFDAIIDMVAFRPQELESAIRAFGGRTGQYIFCSTTDVYTKPAARYPVAEGAERAPSREFGYAFEKARCERLLETAHERRALEVTVIRPAQTYVDRLVHTFRAETFWIDRMRKGMPVIVHGDGQSLWAACHRDDVAAAFVNAVCNPATYGRAYHVTGEEWMTWDHLYTRVAEAAGAPPPQLVHIPTDLLFKADPERALWCKVNFQFNSIFDDSRARSELGFRYTVPFADGAKTAVARMDARGLIAAADLQPWYDRLIDRWTRLGEGMAAQGP